MEKFQKLHDELAQVFTNLRNANLLDPELCQQEDFLQIINQSPYYITVHDVEAYRPICLNERMRDFYGFESQVLKGLDHLYYLRTIHTSTYHTLVESIAFFRKDRPGILDLNYKLLNANKEWKLTFGSTKTLVRSTKNRPKIALTIMDDLYGKLSPSVYDYFRSLTKREREVAMLLDSGLSKKQIAEHLFISADTVVTHTKHIYKKLHINKISELTAMLKLIDFQTLDLNHD